MPANEWEIQGTNHILYVVLGLLVISPARDDSGKIEISWRYLPDNFIIRKEGSVFVGSPEGLDAAKKRAIEWGKELLAEALQSLEESSEMHYVDGKGIFGLDKGYLFAGSYEACVAWIEQHHPDLGVYQKTQIAVRGSEDGSELAGNIMPVRMGDKLWNTIWGLAQKGKSDAL